MSVCGRSGMPGCPWREHFLAWEAMMVWWVLWLSVVTVLAYLADAGFLPWVYQLRVPFLNASATSVLLVLTTIGLIYRVQGKRRAGERETLVARVEQLERELAAARSTDR